MCVCVHVYVCVNVCVHSTVCVSVHVYLCMCVHVCVCVYLCVCACICVCVCLSQPINSTYQFHNDSSLLLKPHPHSLQGPEWNISRMDQAGMGVVLLKRGVAWVELATDLPIGWMDSLGLLDCLWLANVSTILSTEAHGESAARSQDLVRTSSTGGRSLREAEPAGSGSVGVEAWFTQYVSLGTS